MKNAKIYIIYIVVVVALSYAITYGMRIWQHGSRFKDVKPFLERQLVVEKWQAGEGLSLRDFGTFSMGLPVEDMQMVSITVLPDGKIIDPFVTVSTNKGSFKFSQPVSVDMQKQELEKMKSQKPDDENIQHTNIRDFQSFKEILDVKMLGYFDFVKLDKESMDKYISNVNEKASILQKAKDIVLFETDDLNGVLLQVEGVIKAKDGSGNSSQFANAEVTVWTKSNDISQKFIVSGKPGEISSSVELVKKIIPTVNYAGREVSSLEKQVPICLESIKNMEWFKFLQLNVTRPENVEPQNVPQTSLDGIGVAN